VHVAVEHFDVGVGLDLAAAHSPACPSEADGLDRLAHDLEGNLLQVEDDVGGVFDHARNRAELVLDAFDATAVMAAPSIELSSTRRRLLPIVVRIRAETAAP
jgi:hypothetical protein